MENKIELSEKIELYMKYGINFFDYNDKKSIYEVLVNREDLLEQLNKTPDEFWNEVKKQKLLYVYIDSKNWKLGSEKRDRIVTKFQDFYNKEKSIPVLTYEKEMENIFTKKKYIKRKTI